MLRTIFISKLTQAVDVCIESKRHIKIFQSVLLLHIEQSRARLPYEESAAFTQSHAKAFWKDRFQVQQFKVGATG